MRKSKYPKATATLGQKIRKRRMDMGILLVDVANKAQITESYLSRIEADKQKPSVEVVEQIELALGVPEGEFAKYSFPLSPVPNIKPDKVYDMVITVGNAAAIGIDIKVKRSKTLNPELIAQKIENALITSFPDSAVKLNPHSSIKWHLQHL